MSHRNCVVREKPLILTLLYAARNFQSRKLFTALREYCRNSVLDVGGYDFYLTAKRQGVPFTRWTTLEKSSCATPPIAESSFCLVQGDGCNMTQFQDCQFDTVLCLQVLEHVFDPVKMVNECKRVLRQGGFAIFLVPQTSVLHMVPHHYCNFTRYWILEAMQGAGFRVVSLTPIGGRWQSTASHMVYFFLQSLRCPGFTIPGESRGPLFYLLFPFMVIWALINIPVCLLLSLGDLREEANNHLVVAQRP